MFQSSSFIELIKFLYFILDTTPNVDYFNREEVKELVRKFKDEFANGALDEVSFSLSYPSFYSYNL